MDKISIFTTNLSQLASFLLTKKKVHFNLFSPCEAYFLLKELNNLKRILVIDTSSLKNGVPAGPFELVYKFFGFDLYVACHIIFLVSFLRSITR